MISASSCDLGTFHTSAKAHAEISWGARGLHFDQSHHLCVYLCMRAAKALASLCFPTGLPKPSLLGKSIRSKISCAGSFLRTTELINI